MLAPNFPDNNYKEIVNKVKKQLENEEDNYKRLKLMEQLSISNLFSFNNGCYTKYKNPW